jgi:hypothetical protein
MLTLSQMQAIAKAPISSNNRKLAAERLARSVAQSLRVEGYDVTAEQSAEASERILGK